jgi:hypothetical protein
VAALGLLALLVCATGLAAQSGRVEGRVWRPNGRPVAGARVTLVGTSVAGARVTLVGTSASSLTNESGHYVMVAAPGLYRLHAEFIGYVSVAVANVLVRSADTTRVNVGLGPRPPNWQVLEDTLLRGTDPPRRITLFVDSLGLVPTPGDSAHRRTVAASAAARGLSLVSDSGGVMVFWVRVATSWDTLAVRDSAFRLAGALRRELPTLVRQAGPVVRYRPGGPPFVATDEVVVRFDSTLSFPVIDSLNRLVGARTVYRNPFVANDFLVQALDFDGIALSNAYWSTLAAQRVRSAYPNFRIRSGRSAGPTSDPLSADQWHLKRINVSRAWPRVTGGPVVAVIEQDGFEVRHPDLQNRLWNNATELGGDEDGNGLVDDRNGANFSGCPTTPPEETDPPTSPDPCGDGRLEPLGVSDTPNHGTPVAGLVAADSNGLGVVGVCPGCRLMLIVVDRNDANSQRLGFEYAEANGAQAVNLSWVLDYSPVDYPDYAWGLVERLARKRVVIASSGNYDQDDCALGFRALPDVIVVGASSQRDKRIPSGKGDCLTVLAPGGRNNDLLGITTTDVAGKVGFNTQKADRCRVRDFPQSATVPDWEYTRCFGGTSAAAPIVSGVVGLMLAVNGALKGPEIEKVLEQTADKIDAHAADYDATGKSITHGYGRVNACAAVLQVAVDPNWRECAVMPPWLCRWWIRLLAALVVAVLVFLVLTWTTGSVLPLWARLALSLLAGAVAFLLLWLFCQLLIVLFCLVAAITVAVLVFLIWRTLPLVWRLIVSLLAGAGTFGIFWLLLKHLA